MSLKQWLNEGKLKPHQTNHKEIQTLLKLVERDIQNALLEDLSPDWRFSIAYNAALQLATIPLLVAGYRTVSAKGGHHYITITALTETMGADQKARVRFFNTCRNKRHNSTYDNISMISEDEVDELLLRVKHFQEDILNWLKTFPQLTSETQDG